MNPKDMKFAPAKTKSQRATGRAAEVKRLRAKGHSRTVAIKMAKSSIK